MSVYINFLYLDNNYKQCTLYYTTWGIFMAYANQLNCCHANSIHLVFSNMNITVILNLYVPVLTYSDVQAFQMFRWECLIRILQGRWSSVIMTKPWRTNRLNQVYSLTYLLTNAKHSFLSINNILPLSLPQFILCRVCKTVLGKVIALIGKAASKVCKTFLSILIKS